MLDDVFAQSGLLGKSTILNQHDESAIKKANVIAEEMPFTARISFI